jgi:spore coat protein U-like protein
MRVLLRACIAAGLMAAIANAAVCSVSTSGVAFGTYASILNQQRDTSGLVIVTCTGTEGESVNYTISLTAGGGSYTTRTIASSNSSLSYNLYTDAARTQVWGDGTSGTTVVSGSLTLSGSSTVQNHTAYGRIPAGQNQARTGSYSDNMTVTLSY